MPVSCRTPLTLGGLCVEVEASRSVAVRTLQGQFGDGYKARRPDGINTLMETWTVRTPLRPIDEVQDLEDEIIALGPNSFGWTPPHETVEKQWVLEPYQWEWNFNADLASLSFTLSRFYR